MVGKRIEIVDTIVSCNADSSSGKRDRSIFETRGGSLSAINTRSFFPFFAALFRTKGCVALMARTPVHISDESGRRCGDMRKLAAAIVVKTKARTWLRFAFGCAISFSRDWRGQSSGLLLEGFFYCR